mmetsp:Transcript_32433/g.60540  ORF Transcript_32433/g.60540 Transcript_32433/m.60540 type:complete len:1277 (-) Transcript_32433:168-3998(-)
MGRSVRFEYPLSILFAVTHDLLHLDLQQGDIVMVLDYSRGSNDVVIKKNDDVAEVPKMYLKRADGDDIKRYLARMTSFKNSDSSAYAQRVAPLKGRSTALAMPLGYEVIGYKAVQYGDSFVTVFFLLVTPYSSESQHSDTSAGNHTPFHYTRDGSWIIAKSQRCVEKLISKLEKYVGEGNLPPIRKSEAPDDPYHRKPKDWDVSRWLQYRTQAVADFFIAFKNPKRGFYLGNSEHKTNTAISKEYMHNPLLGNILGIISRPKVVEDEFTRQQKEEAADIKNLAGNTNKNMYLKSKADAFLNNDAPLLAAIDSRKQEKTQHLIHGLAPMAHFLHTDKVTLEVVKSLDWVSSATSRAGAKAGAGGGGPSGESIMSSPLMAMYPLLAERVQAAGGVESSLFDPPLQRSGDERKSERDDRDEKRRNDKLVPHFDMSDCEVIDAVQNGEFSVSTLTPLDGLLRLWAVSGLDRREDHKPADVNDADWNQGSRWEEPEENMMSAWEMDMEDNEHEASGSSNDSYEDSDKSDGDGDDYGYGNIYGESQGRVEEEEGAGESKTSRQDLFADRAARAAIMGIESDVLRKKLWKGFVASAQYNIEGDDAHGQVKVSDESSSKVQSSILAIRRSLESIQNYLPERQDAHEGLESFSHFGLMIFSTAITHRSEIEDDADDEECSVGSLTAVQGQLHKTNSSVTNESGVDIDDDDDDIMTRLNKKIHNLFLDWEHRRETAKERINKEKKKQSKAQHDDSVGTSKATPTTSPFVAQVKSSCYKKKSADGDTDRGDSHSTYYPFPSQIRSLSSLSASRLDDYITNRSKTLLSRKSERVLIIERMKGTEKAFQNRRVTSGQMKTLLEAIEGPDERQHAALLLIVRLTDVVEADVMENLLRDVEVSADCEKRMRLAGSILAAEARAEDNLSAIHKLYTKCFHTGQKVKEMVRASRKDEEDADFLRLKSIQKLKDAQLVSPKLQHGLRNKMKDFKSDISMMRQAAAEVHTALTAGFTVHLTKIREEQDAIVKLDSELKLIVIHCESVCRMRGTLTAGRPEYLVFHRLKAALACADKAKTIAGEVLDEATVLLTSMQKTLKRIEDYLASTSKQSTALLMKMSDSSDDLPTSSSISPAKVERELEDYLLDEQHSGHEGYKPMDLKSSIAMKTGLTAACAGAGWRRALQEVSTENFSKFKVLIKPQRDMSFEDLRGDEILTIAEDKSYTSDVTNMCLLLSRIHILKDMCLASNAENQKDTESRRDGGEEGGRKQEEDSMTYDDKEDDFSYAGVYDETF